MVRQVRLNAEQHNSWQKAGKEAKTTNWKARGIKWEAGVSWSTEGRLNMAMRNSVLDQCSLVSTRQEYHKLQLWEFLSRPQVTWGYWLSTDPIFLVPGQGSDYQDVPRLRYSDFQLVFYRKMRLKLQENPILVKFLIYSSTGFYQDGLLQYLQIHYNNYLLWCLNCPQFGKKSLKGLFPLKYPNNSYFLIFCTSKIQN
jgi:hypothetical protein